MVNAPYCALPSLSHPRLAWKLMVLCVSGRPVTQMPAKSWFFLFSSFQAVLKWSSYRVIRARRTDVKKVIAYLTSGEG